MDTTTIMRDLSFEIAAGVPQLRVEGEWHPMARTGVEDLYMSLDVPLGFATRQTDAMPTMLVLMINAMLAIDERPVLVMQAGELVTALAVAEEAAA
jgi:hypothetical protein